MRQNGELRVDVSDTGSGMAAEDLPHIFDRFYRADRARSTAAGNVGLGLPIVKSIVALHGGHVTAGVAAEDGLENWRKAVERIERPLPMLIENTAGGDGAMARSLDAIGKLWGVVADAAADSGENLGFCLDTCHANSAGIDLADAVDRVKAITGRIDLVHCNNSRDPFGSGRDRHANIASGTIDPALLLGVVRSAGATAICETPEEGGGLAADVSWLKQHLGA